MVASEDWVTCDAEYVCHDASISEYRLNKTDPLYLDNWVPKLGLECKSDAEVGFLGSAYFIGILVGLPVLPSVSDKYGRKKLYAAVVYTIFLTELLLTFTESLNVAMLGLFIMGFTFSGKNIVGLSYLDEMLPEKLREDLFTTQFVCSTSISFILPMQYLLISNSWQLSNLEVFIINLIPMIIVPFYLPESPKYFYSKGLYDQARRSLLVIARQNKVLVMKDIKFDKEKPTAKQDDFESMKIESNIAESRPEQVSSLEQIKGFFTPGPVWTVPDLR